MKKSLKRYICAAYTKSQDDGSDIDIILKALIKCSRKIKAHFLLNVDNDAIFIFPAEKIRKIKKFLKNTAKLTDFAEDILAGKMFRCSYCRSKILMKYPYTYRKINGWVGRSYECAVCGQCNIKLAREVRETAKKDGSKAALIKVLNGEIKIKEEIADEGYEI